MRDRCHETNVTKPTSRNECHETNVAIQTSQHSRTRASRNECHETNVTERRSRNECHERVPRHERNHKASILRRINGRVRRKRCCQNVIKKRVLFFDSLRKLFNPRMVFRSLKAFHEQFGSRKCPLNNALKSPPKIRQIATNAATKFHQIFPDFAEHLFRIFFKNLSRKFRGGGSEFEE